MRIKRLVAGILAATMMLSTGAMTASATELTDGDYKATFDLYQDGQETLSMCDPLFGAEADVTVSGDDATIKFYVANPIGVFGEFENGTLSTFTMTYDGANYEGSIEVKNEDAVYFDKSSAASFGIEAGNTYSCDTVTVTVPVAAITQDKVDMSATVTAMGNLTEFDCEFLTFTAVNDDAADDDAAGDVKEVPVTATVEVNNTTYTVTVPETVPFGTLSSAEDNTVNFAVEVEVNAGNDNKAVQVSAEATGELAAGTEAIAFTNSFGTQTFAATGTGNGTLTVLADAVAGIAAGEYAGTVSFAISSVDK